MSAQPTAQPLSETDRVVIFDTTLRDGEQCPGATMTHEEKLAVAELLDRDYEFNLFRHARTAEDVVVYRRGEQDIGLLHPPGSPLSDENDIVVPRPSRYSEPITLAAARSELDVLNDRFLYFTDAEDRRGKVLYLRHDGDYGLVQTG